MKKTLLTLSLITALAGTTLSANAFCWSNLNPFTWGSKCCGAAAPCKCQNKCCPEKENKCCPKKDKCKTEKPKCNTCEPKKCSPCEQKTCNPCDKLQQETER